MNQVFVVTKKSRSTIKIYLTVKMPRSLRQGVTKTVRVKMNHLIRKLICKKGIVPAGILFAGGNPVGSVFAVVAILATIYVPFIADNTGFQKDRAVDICNFNGGAECENTIKALSDKEVLDYIKDDSSFRTADFYASRN